MNNSKNQNVDPKQLNALTLAYMGDAVFEKFVRERLIVKGSTKPHRLHREATKYVSAKAQAVIIHRLLEDNHLDDEEQAVVRRGRNAKSGTVPKNTDVQTYRYSTAFESLLGFHYLMDNYERLNYILQLSVEIIEKND